MIILWDHTDAVITYGDACGPGYTGLRCAPVLGWRAFGFNDFKRLKARQPSTNPCYPYRKFNT